MCELIFLSVHLWAVEWYVATLHAEDELNEVRGCRGDGWGAGLFA